MTRIPILKNDPNRLIAIEAELWSPDQSRSERVPLVLDTGARRTELSKDLASRLGYGGAQKGAPQTRVHTGQSVVKGVSFMLSRLRLGGVDIRDFEVNCTDFEPGLRINGLLGLDLFDRLQTVNIRWKDGIVEFVSAP